MVPSPASVEPKWRTIAYFVTAALAIVFGLVVGFSIYSAIDSTLVITSRTDYGVLPNIWLCSWQNGSNVIEDGIVQPDLIQVKETGSFKLLTSDIFFDQRPWPFASQGGLASNGQCAFFELSAIVDPNVHLFVKIQAHLSSSATSNWRDCAVYADSPAHEAHGSEVKASQSVIGWMGAAGKMPVLYTTMSKHIVGTEYFLSATKHAEYYGTVLGTYAGNTQDLTDQEKNKVEVWLDIPIKFSGVPGAAESLQQAIIPRLFRTLSRFGGLISIITIIFAVFFTQKHPHAHQLTLRTPQHSERVREAYDAMSDDEYVNEGTFAGLHTDAEGNITHHDLSSKLASKGWCPSLCREPSESSDQDNEEPASAGRA